MSDPAVDTRRLREQYQDASNLAARAELHARFSTNPYGWHRWVFDQIRLPPKCAVLELGCGNGRLWLQNNDRVPPGWRVVLSDLSPGMLAEARRNLHAARRHFKFMAADAQAIPAADGSVGAIIANHMLYHVPDLSRALVEIRRVLKPRGLLYTSTVGSNHLREIDALISRVWPDAARWTRLRGDAFLLDNGLVRLSEWFSEVTLHRYPDGLLVAEAGPMVAYILSMIPVRARSERHVTRLRAAVEEELAASGAIPVTKETGLFVALRGHAS